MENNKYLREEIIRMSGVNTSKCMKCGKCSASCPSYHEMDIKPHQFVSYVVSGNIEGLLASKSAEKCLGCFACIERCPRGVEPGKLVDAARQLLVRQRGEALLSPDEVPRAFGRGNTSAAIDGCI